MFDKLKRLLERSDAEYADLRYETKHEVKVAFAGKELAQTAVSTTDGYVLRVLCGGGFSSLAFTREADAEQALRITLENARLIARHRSAPVRLAAVKASRAEYLPVLDEDPRRIAFEEKIALTRRYNDLALGHPSIVSTSIAYGETIRNRWFISTEGAEVREDLVTVGISGLITSRDAGLLQNVRIALGGAGGFKVLRDRDQDVEHKRGICVDLLKAQPVAAGTYNVILNNSMSGVFAHEAFGHFSEADLIEDNPTMRQKMRIGSRLGNPVLSITDDPTLVGPLGHYRFDDEGVPAVAVPLLRQGELVGHLHSRRTAAEFGETPNGHCVAEDYRYAPIIRMGTIYIEPGKDSVDGLFQQLGDGLYVLDAKGGQTSGENFTFGAQYGYLVKGGKAAGMVRDINVGGNLYQTMESITAVANDFRLSQIGGCGKEQMNIRSCHGGPHILVEQVVIGGA